MTGPRRKENGSGGAADRQPPHPSFDCQAMLKIIEREAVSTENQSLAGPRSGAPRSIDDKKVEEVITKIR